MTLTIDVGNTQINGGLFDNEKLVLQFRLATSIGTSSDEIGIFLRNVMRENGYDWKNVSKIGCCSVVPSINYSIASAFTKYFEKEVLFIQAGIKTGLKLKYSNPKEIGADRIAACMGAVSLYPDRDLLIIEMGTANTIDVVTENKEYLGGAILPGLTISVDALANGTAKLPSVEIQKPEHINGTTTAEAIQAGLFYGNAGAIKELSYLYQKNIFHGQKPFIIGTGGFAKIYGEYNLFDTICPHLVLLGVKKAIEMNI